MASTAPPPHLLDDPVRAALEGPQRQLAERHGDVLTYPREMAPFIAFASNADQGGSDGWSELAGWLGPGGRIARMAAGDAAVPSGWEIARRGIAVQMTDAGVDPDDDPRIVRLGPADVPQMLGLVARTEPGPFLPRTIELGAYWGIREAGKLVAMSGERFRPSGWTEVSAVCTDPGRRGRGLGAALVRKTVLEIRRRGDRAFLHVFEQNQSALRLYESLGFVRRRECSVLVATVAQRAAA